MPNSKDGEHVDTEPIVKELWERSIMIANVEVVKGWNALNPKIHQAGKSLARDILDDFA